ncbi:MAG: hypothetical protein QOE90_2445 [Thermoplasmata archaeon]|jgi:hypothetical protein|nr:hypothetical protein [Thermoplasmata archaeon]
MGIALGTMLLALTLTPTSGVPSLSAADATVTVPDAPQVVDTGTWDPTADVVPGQRAAAPVVPSPSPSPAPSPPPSPSPQPAPVAQQPVLPEPPTDWTLPLTPDGNVSTGAPAPTSSPGGSSAAQDPPAAGAPSSDAPQAPAPAAAPERARGAPPSTLLAAEASSDPPQLSRAQLGAMGAGIVLLYPRAGPAGADEAALRKA